MGSTNLNDERKYDLSSDIDVPHAVEILIFSDKNWDWKIRIDKVEAHEDEEEE